jgi:segregation and condensation protein B
VIDQRLAKNSVEEQDGEGPQQQAAGLTLDNLKGLLESLLFVADGAVALAKLERTLGIDRETLERTIAALREDYVDRGLRVQRFDGRVQMVTAPEAAPYVESFLGLSNEAKLSPAALETLAIIAYRQPVTRAGIEAVRGVNGDRVLSSLLARELICEVGRADTVGRPVLFGTTFVFLEYFGLNDLSEMPPLDSDKPAAAVAESRAVLPRPAPNGNGHKPPLNGKNVVQTSLKGEEGTNGRKAGRDS